MFSDNLGKSSTDTMKKFQPDLATWIGNSIKVRLLMHVKCYFICSRVDEQFNLLFQRDMLYKGDFINTFSPEQ